MSRRFGRRDVSAAAASATLGFAGSVKDFTTSLAALPKMIVLDIDRTIWPFWVDTHVSPPFKSDGNGGAKDAYGYSISLYKDVRTIFSELEEAGIPIAAASRTEDPPASRELLSVLGIDKHFSQLEIFPDRKYTHFKNISQSSGVSYKDMLFFDDEYRNIVDISKIGVTCVHIDPDVGLDMAALREGLEQFNRQRSS